jgi:hypothetical protein
MITLRNPVSARSVCVVMKPINPMKYIISLLTISGVAMFTACSSGPMAHSSNTTRGAVGGAAAGAVLGGIIGHQSGDAGAGAALGAAAGAVAGGAYGNQKDRVSTGSRDDTRDSYGFTHDDYYNLMTPQERALLHDRAGGRGDVNVMSYLTSEERANLRRRAGANREIGR